MKRFNSYTWLLKCWFAPFSLKSQTTKPYPQLNKQLLPLFLSIFQIQPPNTSKMKHYCCDTTLLIKSKNGEWCGKKFTSFISISQDCWIHKTALNHTDPGPTTQFCPFHGLHMQKWHIFILATSGPSRGKSLELQEHVLFSLGMNVLFTLVLQ